jgi:hypothetical protein
MRLNKKIRVLCFYKFKHFVWYLHRSFMRKFHVEELKSLKKNENVFNI